MDLRQAMVAARAIQRSMSRGRAHTLDLSDHLHAAYRWIATAQDATPDDGVAGCYNLVRGWAGSYPETTGYIIPTLLHYSALTHDAEARLRAIRMADWECDVQMPSGAVRSGMLGTKVGPAVFNTGQVLFGWVAASQLSGDRRYYQAAAKAAQWLVSVQDDDGAWRKHLSMLTTSGVQTYNVRAAWGLALAGVQYDKRAWIAAAERNCDWVLRQQNPNGWFSSNTFTDTEEPLLHTIGYVLEGLLGVGELTASESYIAATIAGVEPLRREYERLGILFGRYDAMWNPVVRWRCLTGEAQIAIVLQRLARITGDKSYQFMADALISGVAAIQNLDSRYRESYGSIPGSEPLWGGYGPFNYFNWAAKFFMDAVLLKLFNVDVQTSLHETVSKPRIRAAS